MIGETYLNDGWEFIETRLDHPEAKIGYSTPEWLPAVVPGHIHLDLMQNGIIADPFEQMNEIGVQWVDERDWSYRCTFEWHPEATLPRRVLFFEGLDTVCRVLLNGEQIATHDNMFVPLEVDVTDKLVDGENVLRIDFESAQRVGGERREAYFAKEGLPLSTIRFDDRAFVRKVQCMSGWDWGPRLVSCGVWKPVRLLEFASRITSLSAQQEWQADGSVIVKAIATQEGEGALSYSLHIDEEEPMESEDGVFHVQNPPLWWPAGHGEQLLQTLYASLDNEDSSDLASITIGFRKIQLLREKDEMGESFEFEVNGRKIYCTGFNWIPDHSFPSIVTRSRYFDRLAQALDLGSNMLRVWGGGLYETDDFYDLCDEMGLMVWQDFPHACSYYPDDNESLEIVKAEATYNIKRLRHRASLALWCANNENLQMWQQKWFKAELHPPRYYGDRIYNELLPPLVQELDPERSYINTSPCGDSVPDSNGGKIGDSHYWDAWHGRGDWKYYLDSEARFSSEYGIASSCSLALWEETLSEDDWDYRSPAVRWHDKTGKGYDTFVGFVKLHYPEPETLEDWTYYSQLNQRDALRMGVEHFRRNAFCRGSLIWQLNDCWPVQSWAVIDSSGRYKAAAYELRRLYDHSLYSLERVKDKVKVHFVCDSVDEDDDNGLCLVTAIDLSTGESIKSWSFDFPVVAGMRQVIGEIDLTGLSVPDTLIYCGGTHGAVAWHLLGEPKEMNFAPAGIILGSNANSNDIPQDYDFEYFTIQVGSPVVDLMLSVDGDTDVFIDNFLTIESPDTQVVRVKHPITHFEARSLAGDHRTSMTRSPLN